MKRLLYCSIIMLLIGLGQSSYGVTFKLKIDYWGNLTLQKGNEVLKNSSTTVLDLQNMEPIVFIFENASKNKITLNIKGQKEQITFNDTDFYYSRSIATDENLVLTSKEKSANLNGKFTLYCGSDRENTLFFEFVVRVFSVQEPVPDNLPGRGVTEALPATQKMQVSPPDYKAGSMIYDALTLAEPQKHEYIDFLKIMRFYFGDTLTNDLEILQKAIDSNPFLKVALGKDYMQKWNQSEKAQAEGPAGISSYSLSSIGGLDVTNIADGLAKFLVKRTKQELSIAFFEKFKKTLNDTNFRDLQTVFPNTYNLLNVIDEQIYDYQKYIQNLRAAFKSDLKDLNKTLPGIIENHKAFFILHSDLEVYLRSGCYIAGKLEDRIHPGEILANYPIDWLDKLPVNFKGAIQTIQLVSESLRDSSSSDSASYWVSAKRVKELVNNKTAFRIYLGLFYQELINEYGEIHFQKTTLNLILDTVAANFLTDYDKYKMFIVNFEEKADILNKMIKEYAKPATDSAAFELYAKFFTKSVDLIEYCTTISELPHFKDVPELRNLQKNTKDYFDISYSACDMVIDINRKNYSSAINHALRIYNIYTVKKRIQYEQDTAKAKIEINEINDKIQVLKKNEPNKKDTTKYNKYTKDMNGFKLALKRLQDSLKAQQKSWFYANDMTRKLARYGSFFATVATAKSSDDVDKAIESFALPTGSSRIKRETPFNVSLNAYCGLFAGFERIKGIDAPWTWNYQKFNSYGVTAPLGIAISRGHSIFFFGTGKEGWNEKSCGWKAWSSTIFVSLIDIGALAAFRFTDDSTQTAPAIKLQDIISPGIFYSLGIPKSPVSINFGWQVGPLLRTVTAKTTAYKNSYTRISVSVCVDIPILNFYTVPKKN